MPSFRLSRALLLLAALAPYAWWVAACGSSEAANVADGGDAPPPTSSSDATVGELDADTSGDSAIADDGGAALDGASDGQASMSLQTGLYVVTDVAGLTDAGAGGSKLAQLLTRSYVHGVTLDLSWAELEPTPGVYDATVVINAVATVRALTAGRAVTVKLHLGNGIPPSWVTAGAPDARAIEEPEKYVSDAGIEMLVLPRALANENVQLVPTDSVYQAHVRNNVAELARQLEAADPANLSDPDAQLVKIVQLSGPSAAVGGTIRLEYYAGFPGPDSGADASDAYMLGFTYPAYLDAWKAAATFFATDPSTQTFRSRLWTFDITTESQMGSAFSLSVTDQEPIVSILEAAHPLGAAGVRFMDESLGANSNTPDFPAPPMKCNWMADQFTDPTSDVPAVAARPLHEWQLFVESKLPGTMPRFELARNALFVNPKSEPSTLELQHTQFVEIHDQEVIDDGTTLPDDSGAASGWYACLDSMIRAYAPPSRALSEADQTFWAAFPSPANAACSAGYPVTPEAGTCAVP